MNPTPSPSSFFYFSPLIRSHIILNFLFSLLSLTTLVFSSLDPKFQACEPKRCEIYSQSITYPFYIKGKQQPFCGYPRFELICGDNGFPILNTSNTQYMVHQIFYHNQSLRVSLPAFSEPNTTKCIAQARNFTPYSERFRVAPNQKELLLFYGCDSRSFAQEKKIGIECSAENETTSVVGLYREDQDLSTTWKNCKGEMVSTTVEDEKGGIKEALQRGFLLNWRATNCEECENSGGRCGFDLHRDTYAFRCYCPDKVYVDKCTPPG